jgi:hypothetical protein
MGKGYLKAVYWFSGSLMEMAEPTDEWAERNSTQECRRRCMHE